MPVGVDPEFETAIRLRCEFVYLAVVLDAYSRRVIGWTLERTLEDHLSLAALQMALSQRQVRSAERPRPAQSKLRTRHEHSKSKSCSGAEWNHSLFFSTRNKRWLDFAHNDDLICRDTPIGEPV